MKHLTRNSRFTLARHLTRSLTRRALFGLVIGVAAFTLSGCVNIQFDQTINKDGYSHAKIVLDMSAFGSTIEGMQNLDTSTLGGLTDTQFDAGSIEEFNKNLENGCDAFYADTTMENATCVRDGYVITYEGDVQLTPENFTIKKSFPYITYQYQVSNVYEILSQAGKTDTETDANQFSEDQIAESKASADLIGMEMNYALTMPAAITLAPDAATIDDADPSQLTLSLFDVAGGDQVVVEAQALNWLWISIVIVVGLVLLVIFVMVMMMKLRRKKAAKHLTSNT